MHAHMAVPSQGCHWRRGTETGEEKGVEERRRMRRKRGRGEGDVPLLHTDAALPAKTAQPVGCPEGACLATLGGTAT